MRRFDFNTQTLHPVGCYKRNLFSTQASEHHQMRVMLLAVLTALICPSLGQETSPASPQSLSIESLQRELSSVQKVAVDAFWARVSIRCCSIVESDPTDPNYSLVTFVWKGGPGTKNVVVISPLALVDFDDAIMQRLGDTEIWFRTSHALRCSNDVSLCRQRYPCPV
jgi:hypothetical protein